MNGPDFNEIACAFTELFENDLTEEQMSEMIDKNLPDGALGFFERYSDSRRGLGGKEMLLIGYLIGVTTERVRSSD